MSSLPPLYTMYASVEAIHVEKGVSKLFRDFIN